MAGGSGGVVSSTSRVLNKWARDGCGQREERRGDTARACGEVKCVLGKGNKFVNPVSAAGVK